MIEGSYRTTGKVKQDILAQFPSEVWHDPIKGINARFGYLIDAMAWEIGQLEERICQVKRELQRRK